MMRNENDTDLKNLVEVAGSPLSLSKKAEERIFTRMAELTAKRRQRSRLLTFFKYTPALTYIVILAVLLPVCLWTGFSIFIPGTSSSYPLTLISDSGVLGDSGDMPPSGYILKENDRIVTPAQKVCDLRLKDTAGFRFFPGSEAFLVSYSQFSSQITIQLDKGSLYVNKRKTIGPHKQLIIKADRFHFLLTGTRLYIKKTLEDITAVCFDGRVEVIRKDEHVTRQLVSLLAGEKIHFSLANGKSVFNVASPSDEEILIDEKNKEMAFIRKTSSFEQQIAPEKPDTDDTDQTKQTFVEGQDNENAMQRRLPETKEEQSRSYNKVQELARLPVASAEPGKVLFFSACHDEKSIFIVSTNRFFRVRDGSVDEPVRFPSQSFFRIKPVLAGKILILAEANCLFLIDKDTCMITHSIPLGEKGVIEDNYYPQVAGDLLYVPIKNRGYYTLNLQEKDDGLQLLHSEPFPFTPVIQEHTIFVGAFYENYITAMDREGRERWKISLPGKSFCNPVWVDRHMYVYLLEKNIPKIIEITDKGRRSREWILGEETIADILPYENSICGFYATGSMFVLDLDTSHVFQSEKIFRNTLSTRAWRNYYPLIHNGFLYTGSDDGKLIVFDLKKKKTEHAVVINEGESFYTAPFITGNTMYIISNSGILYTISKR
jgi:hypothetical protein